ncbi:MAG TPA: DUF202 domain-containing protein [Terriglobales bacterium]|jgi:putative membrane protein
MASEHLRQQADDEQSYDAKSFQLSSSRTGLSLQRTRMSADRTLMSIIRTALSLIGFGFTIFQFFRYLKQSNLIIHAIPAHAPAHFGLALVLLGNLMLLLGIWNHAKFIRQLRRERTMLAGAGLIHMNMDFPISLTLVIAALLFVIGLVATLDMLLQYAQ